MTKEEALNDFLKGLRIVLNNASAYFKTHPYFIKSVENFKQTVDSLFEFLNPIKIEITPNSLFIDGKYWDKLNLFVELAQLFHLRKIKGIEFREGATCEELVEFLSSVSKPIKEILRQGGLRNILNRENSRHLSVTELDYSELLRDEGEETKDIWVYLFRIAIENEDLQKINEFADNFEKILAKFRARDLLEDDELRQNIYNFLIYLKGKARDKFYSCLKTLLRFVLSDNSITPEDRLEKIKAFFRDLNKDDFAEALLDQISNNERFNYLSFAVLAQFIDQDMHKDVAASLEARIKNTESLKTNPKIRKKIKELFSVSDKTIISGVYRHALQWLCEADFSESSFTFDYTLAQVSYRFVLLNLLSEEKDKEALALISACLLKESEKLIEERNLEYFKLVLEVIDKKIKEDTSLSAAFTELLKRISIFIETISFEDPAPVGLDYFVSVLLSKSFLGFDFYMEKIFNEGRVNSFALKLLLRLFPEKLPIFLENLEKRYSDIDLLGKVVKGLGPVDSPKTLEILKEIFSFSNNIIKIEVLKSMQNLTLYDKDFLFSVLKKGDILLKKETLVILAKNAQNRDTALQMLLCIKSPFGIRNKVLMQHLMIVEDLGLKAAKDYLVSLSKRYFFWNRNIRTKASEILGKLAC